MSRVDEANDGRVTSLTLDTGATAQVSVVNAASENLPNDPSEPEVGFLIRVWQPHGSYPGRPDGEGGYVEGTGHNCTTLSAVVEFDGDVPVLRSLDYRGTDYNEEFIKGAVERRERNNTEEAKRERKRAEADRLEQRAAQLRAEMEQGA